MLDEHEVMESCAAFKGKFTSLLAWQDVTLRPFQGAQGTCIMLGLHTVSDRQSNFHSNRLAI